MCACTHFCVFLMSPICIYMYTCMYTANVNRTLNIKCNTTYFFPPFHFRTKRLNRGASVPSAQGVKISVQVLNMVGNIWQDIILQIMKIHLRKLAYFNIWCFYKICSSILFFSWNFSWFMTTSHLHVLVHLLILKTDTDQVEHVKLMPAVMDIDS